MRTRNIPYFRNGADYILLDIIYLEYSFPERTNSSSTLLHGDSRYILRLITLFHI